MSYQVAEGRLETTTPLLRPDQTHEIREEADRIDAMLKAPPHISGQIQDRGQAIRTLRTLNQQLEVGEPREYQPTQMDTMIAREKELREKFVAGMPSQKTMRTNPAGAVDKHRRWEAANKEDILEWKNIRRRLHASGAIDAPIDATDISNIEMYRPTEDGLNQDNRQIETKDFYIPHNPQPVTVMDDEKMDVLREYEPGLLDKLALMDPEQRAMVGQLLDTIMNDSSTERGGGPSLGLDGGGSRDGIAPETPPAAPTAPLDASPVPDTPKPRKARKKRVWTDAERAEASRKAKENYRKRMEKKQAEEGGGSAD